MIFKDVAITGYDKDGPIRQIGIDSYDVTGLFIKLSRGVRTTDFKKVNIMLLETRSKLFGDPVRFGIPQNTFGIIDIYIKIDYQKYAVLNQKEKQLFFWNIISKTFTKHLWRRIEAGSNLKDILKKGEKKIDDGELNEV